MTHRLSTHYGARRNTAIYYGRRGDRGDDSSAMSIDVALSTTLRRQTQYRHYITGVAAPPQHVLSGTSMDMPLLRGRSRHFYNGHCSDDSSAMSIDVALSTHYGARRNTAIILRALRLRRNTY